MQTIRFIILKLHFLWDLVFVDMCIYTFCYNLICTYYIYFFSLIVLVWMTVWQSFNFITQFLLEWHRVNKQQQQHTPKLYVSWSLCFYVSIWRAAVHMGTQLRTHWCRFSTFWLSILQWAWATPPIIIDYCSADTNQLKVVGNADSWCFSIYSYSYLYDRATGR